MTKKERRERAFGRADDMARWFLEYRADILTRAIGGSVRMTGQEADAPIREAFLPSYEVDGRCVPDAPQGSSDAHIRLAFTNFLNEMARQALRRETMHRALYKSSGLIIYVWREVYNWAWAISIADGSVIKGTAETNFLLETKDEAFAAAQARVRLMAREQGLPQGVINSLVPSGLVRVDDPIEVVR